MFDYTSTALYKETALCEMEDPAVNDFCIALYPFLDEIDSVICEACLDNFETKNVPLTEYFDAAVRWLCRVYDVWGHKRKEESLKEESYGSEV